jgi:hypothetical protein
MANVDMDEGLSGVAAEPAHLAVTHGIADEGALADARNEKIGRHALHVIAAIGPTHSLVVIGVTIAGTHDYLATEMVLEIGNE